MSNAGCCPSASAAGYFYAVIASGCDLTQHSQSSHCRYVLTVFGGQTLKLTSNNKRAHIGSQIHSGTLRKLWPASLRAAVFQSCCKACRSYPANQSWESCKAWKALILDTCLLLARGDIFTLWPEVISTPLLFSHFSAHGSLWCSSNWSDVPQETSAPQSLDCKSLNNQTNRESFKKTREEYARGSFQPQIHKENKDFYYA